MSVEKPYPKITTLNLPEGLIEKLDQASNLIKSTSSQIKVISHYDADGLSAGALISAVLLRLNLPFHLTLQHNLDPDSEIFSELKKPKDSLKIFLDMGSSRLDKIQELSGWNIILDHHKPSNHPNETSAKNIVHINPHLFGIDGSKEISAATLAFLQAISLTHNNWDLIHIGLAGAIGDKQHKNGFNGVNLKLVQEALEHNVIEERLTLKLGGNTIKDALIRSTDPYFTGLSNNESAIKKLLGSLKIDPESGLDDLEINSKKRLVSYLILKLIEQGIPPEDAQELITPKYYDKSNGFEIENFSHVINACGRMGRMGLGVAAALGDKESMELAKKIRFEHKQKILKGLKELEKNRPKELKNIQYFYEPTAELAGTFAGIGMMYFFNQNKPVIAITKTDENIKISGRGTLRLVSAGLDLATILAQVSDEVKGSGGGHQIASGATIPLDTDKEFLKKVDKLVGEQLKEINGSKNG